MQTHSYYPHPQKLESMQKQKGLHHFSAFLIAVTFSSAGWFLLYFISVDEHIGLAYVGAITTVVGGGLIYGVSRYITNTPSWTIVVWSVFGTAIMLNGVHSQNINPVMFFMWLGVCPLVATVFAWLHRDVMSSKAPENKSADAVHEATSL